MGFSRQEYCNGFTCPLPWNLKFNMYKLNTSLTIFSQTFPVLVNGSIIIHPCSDWKFRGELESSISLTVSSVTQSCLTLCDSMNCSTPGFPVHYQLPELTETHVHWVSDAIQSFHPLLSPSPPAISLSQHQGLFQWVSSSHQMAKVLKLQHQSFQWIFRTVFL